MSDTGKAFWDFTLKLYGKPGVSPALIGLQDRLGADVNLLLFCCWAATHEVELADGDLAAADRAVGGWREQVVEPLRGIRNRIKAGIPGGVPTDGAMAFRKRVLELEIAGEEIAQHAIAGTLPGGKAEGAPSATARRNLARYLARLAKPAGVEDRQAVDTVVTACFG